MFKKMFQKKERQKEKKGPKQEKKQSLHPKNQYSALKANKEKKRKRKKDTCEKKETQIRKQPTVHKQREKWMCIQQNIQWRFWSSVRAHLLKKNKIFGHVKHSFYETIHNQ